MIWDMSEISSAFAKLNQGLTTGDLRQKETILSRNTTAWKNRRQSALDRSYLIGHTKPILMEKKKNLPLEDFFAGLVC